MASRNPLNGGVKSDKIWRDAIQRAVKRVRMGSKTKSLETLAEKLVTCGMQGDVSALKEIGDRLDGKPTQGIQALDEQGKPTSMKVEVMLVGIKDKG